MIREKATSDTTMTKSINSGEIGHINPEFHVNDFRQMVNYQPSTNKGYVRFTRMTNGWQKLRNWITAMEAMKTMVGRKACQGFVLVMVLIGLGMSSHAELVHLSCVRYAEYMQQIKQNDVKQESSKMALPLDLSQLTKYMSGKYEMAPLPDTLPPVQGWDFDAEAFYKSEQSQYIEDKKGFLRLKIEGYDENPSEDLLMSINQTIRHINSRQEEVALEYMTKAGYTRCDELVREVLGFKGRDEVDVMGWEFGDGLFLGVTNENSGAWRLRSFDFLYRNKGKMLKIVSFDTFPDKEIARIVLGVVRGVPEAYNNLAVLIENRETATLSREPIESAMLFEMAACTSGGCAIGIQNLCLFLLEQQRNENIKFAKEELPGLKD